MALIRHATNEEAKQVHLDAVSRAVLRGKWMAMVWSIDGDGKIIGEHTTFSFPNVDFDNCIDILRRSCDERKTEVVEAEAPPLPLAPHLRSGGNSEGLLDASINRIKEQFELSAEENRTEVEENEKNNSMD